MNTKNIFRAALSMTAALMMTACSSDDINKAAPQGEGKIIPFEATVSGGALTRATVDNDNMTLKFATGDKLYITGTNIKGVLDIQTGTGTASATFSGDLTYTGSGSPASDLALTATLVSAQQTSGTEISVDANTGAVTLNYPTTAYCADVATAVQKYSNLTGTSTYGRKSFTLAQQTAFLNFVITFNDDTQAATTLSAVVKNGETTLCTANVTTALESDKVVAKFVLPVAKGTTLNSATVQLGDKNAISFGTNETLEGKVYNVKKNAAWDGDLSNIPASALVDGNTLIVHDGMILSGQLNGNYKITIADGATVTLDGITINGVHNNSYKWAGLNCAGDATIILKDGTTNTVKGFYKDYPGIHVLTGKTLIIKGETLGTGKLIASSNGNGAGIGGGDGISSTAKNCGNIVIQGGVITATGGSNSAGIGSGGYGSCSDITISGGTVTATGGENAPGIGSGYGSASCGKITITDGVTKVTATAGSYSPNSIGAGGYGSTCGTITIGGTETDGISISPYVYPVPEVGGVGNPPSFTGGGDPLGSN